jgi:hypothetical protein
MLFCQGQSDRTTFLGMSGVIYLPYILSNKDTLRKAVTAQLVHARDGCHVMDQQEHRDQDLISMIRCDPGKHEFYISSSYPLR